MNLLRILILFSATLTTAIAIAEPVSHKLLRVLPESEERRKELYSYSTLDIIDGESKQEVLVVALDDDEQFLIEHGFTYEVVHQDIEAFYASRLTSTPWALMGGYKTFSEIETFLDSLHTAFPTITSAKFSIGSTIGGRQMWVIKISNSPNSDNGTPEVFFNSLIHAREPAGMEALLYYMRWLTYSYGTNAEATDYVNNRQIYFLPCVNPDGYVYNQTTNPSGGGMWRKNRRNNGDGTFGVDCNRNFGLAWGIDNSGSSPFTSDETYRGPSAFSELETQHIRDFVNAHDFVTQNDVHTYSNLVLYPYGTSYYPPPNGNGLSPDNATFEMMADSMNYFIHSVNGVWYTVGTPWQTLYEVNGGSFDWEYGDPSHQKIYAFTTEIGSASDGFWPPTNRILPLAQENFPAFKFMTRIAGVLAPRPYQATLNGQCQTEVNGDGDGTTEPGEGLSLSITLKNTGLNALTSIKGVISTSDPNATVTQSTSAWANLAPNATGNNLTAFTLSISAGSPSPYVVPLNLHLTATNLDTNIAIGATVGNSCVNDNIESGANGWTTGGSNNQWHISTRRANSPTHAWLSGADAGNYGDNMNAFLLSPTLIMGPGAQLIYDEWYNLESNFDFGIVEYNTGTGWTQVGTSVTGASGAWIHRVRSLTIPCAGTPVQLRFRMTTDGNTTSEGWYIDNISTGCPPPPSVTVTAPNGGETWITGENQSITWSTANLTGNIKVELNRSYPSALWEVLFASLTNDGSETWLASGSLSSTARVRISSVSFPTIMDTSNANFSLSTRTVTLTAPNGGEVWIIGSAYSFTWNSTNLAEPVKLELNRDYPLGVWEVVLASTPNDGSQSWTVSGAGSTNVRARITGVTHTAVGDTSNENFTIGARNVTLTSPNGGEIWTIGENRNITWSSLGITGNVWLDLNRLYPMGAWETLTPSTPNTGSFAWTVTGAASTVVRVRVNSIDFPGYVDFSDADFRIANPNQPASITHDPLHDQLPAIFTVTALVSDDYPGFNVKWLYKLAPALTYDSLSMSSTGNPNEYAVNVSPLASAQYLNYVKVTDAAGLVTATPVAAFYVHPSQGVEISYDDGDPERSNWSEETGMQWAVRFTPPVTPYVPIFARIGVSADEPDLNHSQIQVSVLLADGPGGLPGTAVLSRLCGSIGNVIGGVPLSPPNFAYVVLEDTNGNPLTVNSDFYIAVSNPVLSKYESFLEDTSSAYANRSYVFDACDSTWYNESALEPSARRGNRMIRMSGFGLIPPTVVIRNAGADTRLHWTNLHAPYYRLYTASAADGPFGTFIGSTADTTFLEVGGATPALKFYQVRSSTTP